MTRRRRLGAALVRALVPALGLLFALSLASSARAGDDAAEDPEVVVHVPVDQMDVLLEADRRGVLLHYAEYVKLLQEARAHLAEMRGLPPATAAIVRADGTLDLASAEGARLEMRFDVEVLLPGVSYLAFPLDGLGVEDVRVEGGGTYEETGGWQHLRFEGEGVRHVTLTGWARVDQDGPSRVVAMRLPPAAAMALRTTLPPAASGSAIGEGGAIPFQTPVDRREQLSIRPTSDGSVRVAWAPAARAEEGPPVLDAETDTLHVLEDGLVHSRVVVHVNVLRTPVDRIVLRIPPESALRSVGGDGVTGEVRDEDRARVVLSLDKPRRGPWTATLDLETPLEASKAFALPRVLVEGAIRQPGETAVRVGRGVDLESVDVTGGRRLSAGKDPSILRWALADATPGSRVPSRPRPCVSRRRPPRT